LVSIVTLVEVEEIFDETDSKRDASLFLSESFRVSVSPLFGLPSCWPSSATTDHEARRMPVSPPVWIETLFPWATSDALLLVFPFFAIIL